MCLSFDFSPSLLFMDHLFPSWFLQQCQEFSIKTLRKRTHPICPVLQGAAPKLCPSPALTLISPSEYVSNSVGNAKRMFFCFVSDSIKNITANMYKINNTNTISVYIICQLVSTTTFKMLMSSAQLTNVYQGFLMFLYEFWYWPQNQ